jgi:hypothetical protein
MDTVCHSECKSAINNILGHMFVSQKKPHAIFQKFTLHVIEMEAEKSTSEYSLRHLIIKVMFVPASQLPFPAEKLRSQKQEQTVNFSTAFWNVEKQASEEMN